MGAQGFTPAPGEPSKDEDGTDHNFNITCAVQFSRYTLKPEIIIFFSNKIMKTYCYHEASQEAQDRILHPHLLITISYFCAFSLGLF